jgi:purine-binding chemotaxis protein CheW
MNLAEIRKKAEGTKKSATVAVSAPPLEEESGTGLPEPEPESGSEKAELFAAAPEAESYSTLPELPSEPEEFLPVDEPRLTAAADVCGEISAGKGLPQKEAPQTVAAAETTVSGTTLSGATPPRSGYNPLATILTGREVSEDAEESSAMQQQLLSEADVEEYLCFRVADEEYALNIMAIKEIIKPREVTEVPRMPDFISGVISLRGVIIPVMDMRLRLSLPVRGAKGRERIIVLRTDAGFCGVLVDEVVQVARIRKADIEEAPAVLEEIDREFVRGLGHYDNRMLILLNLDTIININTH